MFQYIPKSLIIVLNKQYLNSFGIEIIKGPLQTFTFITKTEIGLKVTIELIDLPKYCSIYIFSPFRIC